MSFKNDDREYARSAVLPDWLESFANRELKRGGNPFEDIRNLFQQKNDATTVEQKVKELCDRIGLDKVDLVAQASEEIPGGLGADKKDEGFDPEQLSRGIEVELKEHTSNPKDIEKAKEIAKDHLTENSKYYDHLEEMEKKMEDEEKKAATLSLLKQLIKLANELEEEGKIEASMIIDKSIHRVSELLAKDDEEVKEPKIFEEHPELKCVIHDVCSSRGGHFEVPALMQTLQNEHKDVKFSDEDKKQLKRYIKQQIESVKSSPEKNDGVSGMSYVVFVVNEGDGNSDIFSSPTRT